MMFPKDKPYRSKKYMAFCHELGGQCCVCKEQPFEQLHHFSKIGMGMKGTDLKLCRVCTKCHERIAGKRRLAFMRSGDILTWIDIQKDGMEMLCKYVEYLEGKNK